MKRQSLQQESGRMANREQARLRAVGEQRLSTHVDLVVAAETQNEIKLREILDENPSLIDESGYKDNTVLIFIAQWGFREILLVLLEYKPDLNMQNEDGDTALIVASREGHYDLCVDLIQAGSLVDTQNKLGRTALMEACCYGRLYVVQLLIYADADLELTDRKGLSALIHSSLWGHRDVMNELTSHGAKLSNRYYLPEEFQGNKLEAKIKMKQRMIERKVPEEERVRRQRRLIEKYYYESEEGDASGEGSGAGSGH